MYRTLLGSLLAATAIVATATGAQAQNPDVRDYSLPAQDLGQSLREVSVRSGRSVIAPSELVARRRAPAVNGRFTAEAAVRRLLAGSGLEVRRVGATLVIVAADPGPGAAASNDDPDSAGEAAIVVTGTNLRGAQPTSPMIVLRREEIDASGSTTLEQLMSKVPQNAQGGVNRENFSVPGAGADPTEHGAGLNLRGLGQRATLVLINGRRVAPSNGGSFVDISLIPVSAVERVEIVTDGASAIYGSDAVGGVVNFILRDDFEGVETAATAGSATEGDGDVLQLGATAGTAWGSGRVMLSYEFRAEDPILAADRDFTIGLAPGTALLPRERRHSLFGNLGQDLSPRLRAELTGSFATRDTDRSFFFSGSPVPVEGRATAETVGLAANLRYDIGAGWVAQLSGGYSRTSTAERQEQPGGLGLVNDRSTRNSLGDLALKLDGSLFDLPGGPLQVALGVEGRHESYRERFRTQTIDLPIEQSRNVAAAFVEAQLPLFSSVNRRPALERLIVTAAARYEHYDDFGSTFDPKLGLLWSPFPGLTLRSSYDTSFRAPLLSETAGAYSAIYVPAALVFIDPSQASGVALALGGSNPEVGPERSRTWTIGGELAPLAVPGLSLTVNYYSIRFSDRIALPSPIITVVGDPAFDSIVTRDPDAAEVSDLISGAQTALDFSGPGFSNGNATPADVTVIVDGRVNNTAITRTSGLDFNLRYSFAANGNRFVLNANVNHVIAFTDQLRPTSPVIRALDTPYRPLDLRLRGQLGWSRGGWSANLFVNHADDYRDTRGNRSLLVGAYTTVDFGVAYEFGETGGARWLRGTRVALFADNLFDRGPPRLLPDPGSTVGTGYDPVNASGRGRFVSLQIRRSW
jgi:iron complex outermembrane receptor protein